MVKIPVTFLLPGEELKTTIGTLRIDIYGELIEAPSVEYFEFAMNPCLNSVSDNIEFDYRRFGYFAAQMKYIIPLNIFWKNDTIYKTLKRYLNKYFNNWDFEITLLLSQKGGFIYA